MKIPLQLFARARDLAGKSPIEIEVPENASVAQLRQILIADFPQLTDLGPSLLWAVNNDYVGVEHVLKTTDEVACFPPVSGG